MQRQWWIPKGLVIPTYGASTGELIKHKICRSDWQKVTTLPKSAKIFGCMLRPSVQGTPDDRPIVVVEAELDAILLQQSACDLCHSMTLGGASKRPDAEAHKVLVMPLRPFYLSILILPDLLHIVDGENYHLCGANLSLPIFPIRLNLLLLGETKKYRILKSKDIPTKFFPRAKLK